MTLDSILNFIIPPAILIIGFYLMFRPLKHAFFDLYERAAGMISGTKKESITTIQYE